MRLQYANKPFSSLLECLSTYREGGQRPGQSDEVNKCPHGERKGTEHLALWSTRDAQINHEHKLP